MLHNKWSLVIAVPVLALSSSVLAQDADSDGSGEQSPLELVNLLEVAELEYQPSAARLNDWERWPGSWNVDFFLVVNLQGRPTYCEPIDLDKQSDLSDRLCADLIANARLKILSGFNFGGRQGVVALSKEPFVTLPGLEDQLGTNSSSVPLSMKDLNPSAFTEYAPLRDFELVRTEGIEPMLTDTAPTYPSYSLRERHQGSSGVILGIDEEGRVESCRPFESSGFARLDNAACIYALEHLEFEISDPTLGSSAPFYRPLKVTWRIPE